MADQMTEAEWKEFKKTHFDVRTTWILSPGRREAYAPMFEGTLGEAIAEALAHATYWQTTTTVFHAVDGRRNNLKLVAKVSVPEGSVLRYW